MSGRFFLWVVFSVVLQLFSQGTYGDESCDIDVENTLKTLLSPDQNPTIQVRALRRDFLRKIKHLLEEPEATPDIANSNINDYGDTRNIEDLYRHGLIRTLHDEEQKRSIANLAKNGHLPMWQVKRGLESLARNGDLHREKELQRLINQFYEKRNLENIMKKLNSPYNTNTNAFYYDESPEKRNVASVARDGGHFGKRNVAALLRQSKYHTNPTGENSNESRVEDSNNEPENMKRSLASIKAQYEPKNIAKRSVPVEEHKSRIKRQDYEYMDPAVYQNQNDYQELVNELNEAYQFPEKRFLGRLPQMGKTKTTPPPKTSFH